jgi:hypothetical protein
MAGDRDDLDRLLDERLQSLPVPRAPETLTPRVMAAVAARTRSAPFPAPWFRWSPVSQVAFVALLVVALGGAVVLLSRLAGPADWLSVVAARPSVAWTLDRLADVRTTLSLARAVAASVTTQPVVVGLAALVGAMSVLCAVLATLLGLTATGRLVARKSA